MSSDEQDMNTSGEGSRPEISATGRCGAGAAIPPRPQVLLCDAGNTLVFLDCAAVAGVLAAHRVVIAPDALHRAQRPAAAEYQRALTGGGRSHEDGWRVYMSALLRSAGIEGPVDELVDVLRQDHDRLNLWRRVAPDLEASLQRLADARPPTRLGVVSNSEGRLAELLEHLGLARWFEVVIDSANEGVAKPDPEIFRRALDRLEAAPAEALYVGDLPEVDVDGARAAGLDAVLVDPDGEHDGYRAAPRVRSVAELVTHWLGP